MDAQAIEYKHLKGELGTAPSLGPLENGEWHKTWGLGQKGLKRKK
jgi:hypothetical protein